MPERKMQETIIDRSEYSVSQQRELYAYRRLGTVAHLKRLRAQEIRRNQLLKLCRKVISTMFWVNCALFDIWVFVSWIDIILHNTSPNPIYQSWNFFTLFF